MPRTKVRRETNPKRARNSVEEQNIEQSEFVIQMKQQLQNRCDTFIEDQRAKLSERVSELNNLFMNFRCSIPKKMLDMKLSEFRALNTEQIDLAMTTNSSITSNGTSVGGDLLQKTQQSIRANKYSREDEGYLTEESARGPSVREGPLSSARARPRRSRSVQSSIYQSKTNSKMQMQLPPQPSGSHTSRSKHRTPMQNRIQTLSADRAGINTVTPKIQSNTPITMMRYPRIGETVISMSGSPVVAARTDLGNANIIIPVGDAIFSIQPAQITSADTELVSKIDENVIDQLKQLQMNLNQIMNCVRK